MIYQIYPRSFCDASGDGVGDLEGIRRHLDHVARLGTDAIWLSPFFKSPMADFGYDVSDYCDVDPLFGDIDTFDRLVQQAHERGLKVIVDFVPNHTSDRHPWFEESRSSRDNPKHDWYYWRDGRTDAEGGWGPPGSEGRMPNNWRAAFPEVGGKEFPPAWTWDRRRDQFYLHLFLEEQPDLNWGNPGVRAAMEDVLRFWMARGVDGFRIDVIHGIGKDPALPDLPPNLAPIPVIALNDHPSAHPYVCSLRSVVDTWEEPPRRMLVGEVVLPTAGHTLAYYGTAALPELNLVFNFHPLRAPWQASAWRRRVQEVEEMLGPGGWWPTWVLSNHDNPRHRTRYGSEGRARAAALLLLTLRGTPFLYAGEELGLEDAEVPPQRSVDPGGRDGCRAPIPWDATPAHGWAGGPDPWLPWPPGAAAGMNVADQMDDPDSVLHLYRRILVARKASPALLHGTFRWIESPQDTLAYTRESGGDTRLVVINFGDREVKVGLPEGCWNLQVRTGRGSGPDVADHLVLRGEEAALLVERTGS
ncbi:MAG TPA: alpha-amylase family glycosyl hydrolase [Acidimicrobiales bacterium]|nr:alpha-amylase family glycosyl hydrolase [Acidimicrobiales bacterium]